MKTVLITGVDKGIGKAVLEKFQSEGFFVIGTYLKDKPEDRDNTLFIQMDISKEESIVVCVKDLKEKNTRIDILINNAGVLLDREEIHLDINKLRDTMEVNLFGLVDFTEKIIPLINEGGHIVNISSIAGSFAHVDTGKGRAPNHYPAYRISKAGLNMYSNTLAEILRPKNICVSSLHPGLTKTEMGGEEALQTVEETAKKIFDFSNSKVETGNFWYNGEILAW